MSDNAHFAAFFDMSAALLRVGGKPMWSARYRAGGIAVQTAKWQTIARASAHPNGQSSSTLQFPLCILHFAFSCIDR
jgi:hypothetical protein